MGYNTIINSQLNKAFNLAKDLAVEVVLSKKINPDFNFSTATTTFNQTRVIITKAIITDIKEDASKSTNMVKKQVMLKLEESGAISIYDSISIDSVDWKIGPIIRSDGYIQIAEIYKET